MFPSFTTSFSRVTPAQSHARTGFTLLEVMLAMLLSAVLLAVLWTALSLHLRAFDSGRFEIERSQLARAVLRKIETDLRRTVGEPRIRPASPPPIPSGTPGDSLAAEAAPMQPGTLMPTQDDHASLVGDLHQLRLRICQAGSAPDATQPTANVEDRRVRLPDDLKTIYYWLADPQAENQIPGAEGMPSGSAFVRRESPWLRWRELSQVDQLFRIGEPPQSETQDDSQQFYRSERPWQEPGAVDDALVIADEVNGLRFRYFDGSFWRTQWNSAKEHALPVAVDVSLMLRDDERNETPPTPGQTETQFQPSYHLIVRLSARPTGVRTGNSTAAPTGIHPEQIPVALP